MAELILTVPEIDKEKLQKVANEAAQKAFFTVVNDYYNEYKSPYQKKVREQLDKQEFSYALQLPDILSKINESLSAEIDRIANEAVAYTYLPLISRILIRIQKYLKWSEVLKMIISELEPEESEYADFLFSYTHDKLGWLNCKLNTPENVYEFTLHTTEYKPKPGSEIKYRLLCFPENKGLEKYRRKMVIRKDDVTIEMPFTPGIIQDKVMSIFMKLMLSNCEIDMDCDSFDDEMFPMEED